MAMERYNLPFVKKCFDQVFLLDRKYHDTRQSISKLYECTPAGVVEEEINFDDREMKRVDFWDSLENVLIKFEETVPHEIASQEDISELLSDVRCYLYTK